MATGESNQSLTSRTRSTIQEILEALKDTNMVGLTVSEINRQLWTRGLKIKWELLTDTVNRMVREGILEERPHPGRKNARVYHLPAYGIAQMSIFDFQYTRDDIEREERAELDLWGEDEAEREQVTVSVLQDIAIGHARETIFAEQVRKAAVALANENPVDLLLEMAEWVVNDINRLANRMDKIAESRMEELRRIAREIGFKRIKAIRFFQRLWRLDAPTEGFSGIMYIPTVQQMRANKERAKIVNKTLAREQLEKRVFGERVIEVVPISANVHKVAVGTDASVGDVQVKHEQGSFIPPTPAVLFVASGAMRVRDNKNSYWDYDIDPRELEKYEDLEAAQKGLLISPRLRREAITDFRHLRSAAMELRQYAQELRVVRREAKWRPVGSVPELKQPPEVTLLIRDGRLFPLVHRLDDYDGASAPDDVLYGEVVRREINAFQEVFQNTTAGHGKLGKIYGGTVKSPEFSWFAMLTFWYLYVKQGNKDLPDGFYHPPLNDQAVTHLLFWGLAEADPSSAFADPRNMFMTFRAVRRFSDIAFPAHPLVIEDTNGGVKHVVNEDNEDDWIDYIERHIQRATTQFKRHQRGVPALSTANEYQAFLDLCRRAGVAMFYGAPARMYKAVLNAGSHFLLPRWELAVDVERLDPTTLDYRFEKMLTWLVDEGGLVRDESHATGGFEEVTEGLPLFIPDIVMQAHDMVVYTRDRHVPDVEETLHQWVRDIRSGKLPSVQP